MRGVRDELAARTVEVRKAQAHPLERPGELADLVGAVVDDRTLEVPGGDQVRGCLEAPNPAGEDARAGVAEERGEGHRQGAGDEHARPHDGDHL